MEFEWDEAKRRTNQAKHAEDFVSVANFDWDTVIEVEDVRRHYGERRWRALGMIGDRLHVLIYTRRGERLHVISLRRANDKEVNEYESEN